MISKFISQTPAFFFKEMSRFFVSPIAYVVMTVYLFLCGLMFCLMVYHGGDTSLQDLLYHECMVLFFIVPVLSMGQVADERQRGTLTILQANPVLDVALLAGKYLASLSFITILVLATIVFPAWLSRYVELDWSGLLVGYSGLIFAAAAFCAIGLCMSAFCSSQILAATLTFVLLMVSLFISFLPEVVASVFRPLLEFASPLHHFEDFARGILDLRHAFFFISCTVLFFWGALLSMSYYRIK